MSKQILVLFTVLIAATAALSCREQEVAPAETPATEEQALLERQEQEAARRAEEVAALEVRLSAVTASVAELKSTLGSAQNPVELEDSTRDLDTHLESNQKLLTELRDAQGHAWTDLRDRLLEALNRLEQRSESTAESVSDWKQREQAAREARHDMTLPIVAKSGLIEGLDGGDYEPYLVSIVEGVQRRLRAEGLYAGEADGYFDLTTRDAVGRFQEREGLAVSGVPSPRTRARLFTHGD